MKQCKCKNPKPHIIGNCEICSICHCLIYKIRNTFHRKTKLKESNKKFKRSREKSKFKRELNNED